MSDDTKPKPSQPPYPILEVTNLRPLPFDDVEGTLIIREELMLKASKAFLCLRSHRRGCECALEEIKSVVGCVFGATVKM